MAFSEQTDKLVKDLIQAEYKNACDNFGEEYNSLYEGYVVLLEEFEEVNNEMTTLNQIKKDLVKLIQNPKVYKNNISDFAYYALHYCNNAIKELAQVGAVLMKIKNTLGGGSRRMKFDKSRVYTTLNANELKVGSKVFVGYTLLELKESIAEHRLLKTIKGIESSEDLPYRFLCDDNFHYPLAYLVEEPKQLKWTDLKLGDAITDGKCIVMVTEIEKECEDLHIFAGHRWVNDAELAGWVKVER